MSGNRASSDAVRDAYARFLPLLDAEDKEGCVRFALSELESGRLHVVDLYEQILAPAARELSCSVGDRTLCIWEEHVRTSIIRTVTECCYPHIAGVRRAEVGDRTKGRAIIVCPTEEYHELGARMAADLFTLCRFDVTFVGANTPQADILDAVVHVRPVFVGVSVTGPYNLIAARRTIQGLNEVRRSAGIPFRIVAGGRAFGDAPEAALSLGADLLLQTYDDIHRFAQEVPWSSR